MPYVQSEEKGLATSHIPLPGIKDLKTITHKVGYLCWDNWCRSDQYRTFEVKSDEERKKNEVFISSCSRWEGNDFGVHFKIFTRVILKNISIS